MLDALEQGRCLVMFDGLDQGLSPTVRRHVISSIHSFIIDHAMENPQTHQNNRFIITSRIADYEPEDFVRYTHYTLFDLNDQLIEYLLAKWCTAIERGLRVSTPGAQHLIEREWMEIEMKQREYWHSILKTHPGLKHLAANPLALTIIAFFQTRNRELLSHRFNLYQVVTRTLLDTWNRESGRKMFSEAQVQLVENLLGRFAEHLQNDDSMLGRYDVEMITRQTMAEFYRQQVHEIKENDVAQLVETLRRSSGLFAQVGDDLFYFANQTFQDYFAALHLIHMPREERRRLAVKLFRSSGWSEPLLLMLMYKNTRGSREEQREVDEILLTILDTPGDSSATVQHNLLFVMSSIVNGSLLLTDTTLIERIHSSAERISQQQSARLTVEQHNLITTFLHRFSRQPSEDKAPVQPLKQP